MPRDSNGFYSLPAGNPVAAGEIVDADWANDTMNDIAEALNDSLSRSGNGGMLAPFEFSDGDVTNPGVTFTNEPTTGVYRNDTGDVRVTILGGDEVRITNDGMYIYNDTTDEWDQVVATNDITVNEDGSITVSAPIDLGDDVTYRGQDLTDYIESLLGGGYGIPQRFWYIWFTFVEPSPSSGSAALNIGKMKLYKNGSGFRAGQRWDKGDEITSITRDMLDVAIPGSIASGSVPDVLYRMFDPDTVLTTIFSTTNWSSRSVAGFKIDFGDSPQSLSGLEYISEDAEDDRPFSIHVSSSNTDVGYDTATERGVFTNVDTRFTYGDGDGSPHFALTYDPTTIKDAPTDADNVDFDRRVRQIPVVVPPGGTTGQVLSKASGDDYDLEWAAGGGGGGDMWTWVYTQQSVDFTAVSGNYYVWIDSGVTITLPASPTVGDIVGLKCPDSGGNILIAGGFGSVVIDGQTAPTGFSIGDVFDTTVPDHCTLVWTGTAVGWAVWNGAVTPTGS